MADGNQLENTQIWRTTQARFIDLRVQLHSLRCIANAPVSIQACGGPAVVDEVNRTGRPTLVTKTAGP